MGNDNRFELRMTGSGGQGLILGSIILAEAAIMEGKIVTQSQVYGAEARGGTTKAELVISNKHIAYPKVTDPDLLAAMTNDGLKQYGGGISRKTRVVIDSSVMSALTSWTRRTAGACWPFPFAAPSSAGCSPSLDSTSFFSVSSRV